MTRLLRARHHSTLQSTCCKVLAFLNGVDLQSVHASDRKLVVLVKCCRVTHTRTHRDLSLAAALFPVSAWPSPRGQSAGHRLGPETRQDSKLGGDKEEVTSKSLRRSFL